MTAKPTSTSQPTNRKAAVSEDAETLDTALEDASSERNLAWGAIIALVVLIGIAIYLGWYKGWLPSSPLGQETDAQVTSSADMAAMEVMAVKGTVQQLDAELRRLSRENKRLQAQMNNTAKQPATTPGTPAAPAAMPAPPPPPSPPSEAVTPASTADNLALLQLQQELEKVRHAQTSWQQHYRHRLAFLALLEKIEQAWQEGQLVEEAMMGKLMGLAGKLNIPAGDLTVIQSLTTEDAPLPLGTLLVEYNEQAKLAVPVSIAKDPDADFVDLLRMRLSHVVSIRRIEVDENTASSDETLLASAEIALHEGRVQDALEILAALSDPARQVMQLWLEQAGAYIELKNSLRMLRRELYALQITLSEEE